MVDQEITIQTPRTQIDPANADRKVAVVGAGPSGLSCAYFLARLGYQPTVFEAENRPGGMLVQTIPAYRLPREILAREIRMIEQLGVEIKTDMRLGRDYTLSSLKEDGYEAVMLAVGAPECKGLGITGDDAENIVLAGKFLKQYNIRGSVPVGKNVVVVGGGNAAIDAARTALRLGAETVDVVYRRTQEQMPAYEEEIDEAIKEGVRLRTLTQPTEIVKGKDGHVKELICTPMELGEFDRSGRRRPQASAQPATLRLPADQVIVAIGQWVDTTAVASDIVVDLTDDGFIKADPITGQTSLPWLFAGGDVSTGPASVVAAIGAGERAAVGIDYLLTGGVHAFWREEQVVNTDYDPDTDPVPYPREQIRLTAVDRRRHSFEEVELPWCEAVALRQAKRCLRCDYGKSVCRDEEEIARRMNAGKEELHV
jgi:NADH-quinone oxidoreductase subunit F